MSKSKYNTSKPSLAVIAIQGNQGIVIWAAGQINDEIELDGHFADALGIMDGTPHERGVWIWEGTFRETVDSMGTNYPMPEGTFRAPTDAEWSHIRRNENPWNDGLWLQSHLLRVN